MTRTAIAAAGFEVVLLFCGGWLAWTRVFCKKARQARVIRLGEWRLPPIDFACFLSFAFVGAASVSAVAGYLVRHMHLDSDAATVAGGAVMHVGILLGLGGFYLMYGARAKSTSGDPIPTGVFTSGLATFLIALPAVLAASNAWEFLLQALGLPDEKQDMVDILQNSGSAPVKAVLVAVATLLVPITEEVLFRAGLFRYFRTRVPRWAAILLTSALFGALHVSWGEHMSGLPSLVPLVVLAIVFCLAYERTGRIGTTIVAHALFNLNTFILVLAGLGS